MRGKKVWDARAGELTFMDCESGGWQRRKSRAWNPERADILWLAMLAAYVWTLSIGAKVCLSPKIHRAAVGKNVNGVAALIPHFSLFFLTKPSA